MTRQPGLRARPSARPCTAAARRPAARQGCRYLRIDTNVRNTRARRLYHSLGYKEIGVVSCTFNGLSDIDLVLLEKAL